MFSFLLTSVAWRLQLDAHDEQQQREYSREYDRIIASKKCPICLLNATESTRKYSDASAEEHAHKYFLESAKKFRLNHKERHKRQLHALVNNDADAFLNAANVGNDTGISVMLGEVKTYEYARHDPVGVAITEGPRAGPYLTLEMFVEDEELGNLVAAAMIVAAQQSHGSTIELLLRHGSSSLPQTCNMFDEYTWGKTLRHLVRQNDPVYPGLEGCTPQMMSAIQNDALNLCRMINDRVLDKRQSLTDTNYLEPTDDARGMTAFQLACLHGSVECVRVLIDAGCNPGARDNAGETGLDIAQAMGHADVVAQLRKHYCRHSKGSDACGLVLAVRLNDLREVERQLSTGQTFEGLRVRIDVNAIVTLPCEDSARNDLIVTRSAENATTALIEAAKAGHLDMVRLLIKHGARPGLCDDEGNTALMCVARQGHYGVPKLMSDDLAKRMVHLLAESGVPLAHSNAQGYSALCIAIYSYKFDMVKTLAALDGRLLDVLAGRSPIVQTASELAHSSDQVNGDRSDTAMADLIDQLMSERHANAARAEAELMAMLDGEEVKSEDKAEKAHKKRAKRKRQLQKKADKKAAAATAGKELEDVVPELARSPEPVVPAHSTTSTTAGSSLPATAVQISNAQTKAQRKKAQKTKNKKKSATVNILEPEETEMLPEPDLDLEPEPEPNLEPEPEVETDAQREERGRFASLQALRSVAMKDWTAEQVVSWVQLAELPATIVDQVQTYVIDDDIDGEELEALIQKGLQKTLKKAKFEKSEAMAQSILAKRDQMLEWQASDSEATSRPNADGNEPAARTTHQLRVQFDRKLDLLGSGRFGHVFRCRFDGEDGYAVKRVDALKASLVSKEIEVLTLVRKTDEGGHPNVVKYFSKEEDSDFVYLCMELCDTETLDFRIKRVTDTNVRLQAVRQLFSGIEYLHGLNIIHRDLKPANILFRGAVLKICDMGQSRILVGGSTVVETGSNGGTLGWMTPEEITATKGGQEAFESRLSGDIHTAGNLMVFILSGGLHAFGSRTQTVETVNGDWFAQQNNIVNGRYNLQPLFASGKFMTCAADLFVRMSCTDPANRLPIDQVVAHPAMWDAETKLRKITEWHKSWDKSTPALARRLSVHSPYVKRLLGDRPEGWLAALNPAVVEQLVADGRHYNGRDVTELLRAIRNVAEHWFQPKTAQEVMALEALTGASAEAIRRGQATAEAAQHRAEAIERCFLRDGEGGFAELLLVFALPRALPSVRGH